MPSLGGGNMDIRSLIGSVVNFAKSKANHVCTAPCDGFVLKMHYRWTFFVFLSGFFSVWYNWYHRDIITCVSHFNADTQVRLDYVNICLSYPFIEKEDGSRRYLLFYRWIHWTFLVLAGIYYIPRKISKSIENQKTKKLFEDMAKNSSSYDHVEAQLTDIAAKYVITNFKTHNGLYYKYFILNIIALLIDITAMHFLDFVLQKHFMRYGFNAYPFFRDPKAFTDYMSVMFPPFASCELDKANQLTAKRTERLGCHLTFMELYEKLFLFLWLWMIILSAVTCLYIVFLILMWIPAVQKFLLKPSKPMNANSKAGATVNSVLKICKIGDVYLLYRIKKHLSHVRFYDLLNRLANPELLNRGQPNNPLPYPDKGKQQQQHPDTLRNRKIAPNQITDPPINPEYLQQIMRNTNLMQRPQHSQNQEMQQRTPLLNKGTSILIE